LRFEGSEPIAVYVGSGDDTKKRFLPKKVLTHCSPFFAAALNGNFSNSVTKRVSQPEDDPEAFEAWVLWIHYGDIPVNTTFPSGEDRYQPRSLAEQRMCVLG
jgi:hypothetical protein